VEDRRYFLDEPWDPVPFRAVLESTIATRVATPSYRGQPAVVARMKDPRHPRMNPPSIRWTPWSLWFCNGQTEARESAWWQLALFEEERRTSNTLP
jgi:hypothetical protein